MLFFLAVYQNMFSKIYIYIYLNDMKYDVKTSEMTLVLFMSRKCMSKFIVFKKLFSYL